MKIYSIGSATLDIFFIFKNLDFFKNPKLIAEKNQVPEIFIDIGGGALNTTYTFKNLNLDVEAIIKLGKDFIGRMIVHKINEKAIPVKIIKEKGYSTFSVIFLNKNNGDKKIFVYRGIEIFQEKDIPIFNDSAYFITSGNTPLNVWENVIKRLKKKNNFIGITPSKSLISKRTSRYILNLCDFVVFNEEEVKLFLSKYYRNFEGNNLFIYLNKILPKPNFKVITLGERGANLVYENRIYFVSAFKKFKTVDTTGAGDCFASTLFAYIIKNLNNINEDHIKLALKLASINSAHNLKEIGAQTGILKERELLRYKNYKLKISVKNIV